MTGKALKKVDESHDQVTMPPKAIDGDQVPAQFDPPALETFEKYSSDLIPFSYDDIDESGKTVAKTWSLPEIKPHTKLIPEPECRGIIDELEVALAPASYDSAKALAEIIVGRGIGTDFNIVKVFVSETRNLFSKYPAYIGFQAVELLESFKYGVPHVGDISAVLKPLVEKLRRALHQARAHLAEHERRAGKSAPAGEFSEKISWFKGLAPALKAAIGEDQFKIFWETLWLVSDDGGSMVLAQPTRFLRDLTAPHLAAISKVADREVELVVGQKPPPGSRKAEAGPRPIRDVIKGK